MEDGVMCRCISTSTGSVRRRVLDQYIKTTTWVAISYSIALCCIVLDVVLAAIHLAHPCSLLVSTRVVSAQVVWPEPGFLKGVCLCRRSHCCSGSTQVYSTWSAPLSPTIGAYIDNANSGEV
jgi:hypothetical protein